MIVVVWCYDFFAPAWPLFSRLAALVGFASVVVIAGGSGRLQATFAAASAFALLVLTQPFHEFTFTSPESGAPVAPVWDRESGGWIAGLVVALLAGVGLATIVWWIYPIEPRDEATMCSLADDPPPAPSAD